MRALARYIHTSLLITAGCLCQAQSIEDYYSEEGLTQYVRAVSDIPEGNYSISYLTKDTVCDMPVLLYSLYFSPCAVLNLHINDSKVSLVLRSSDGGCSMHDLFDHGAIVGDTVSHFTGGDMVVRDVRDTVLHNGEIRSMQVTESIAYPGVYFHIVPGIGDLQSGIFANPRPSIFASTTNLCGAITAQDTLIEVGCLTDEELFCEPPCAEWTYEVDSLTMTPTPEQLGSSTLAVSYGDGNISTALSPHTYPDSGCYTATRTRVTECDTVTYSNQICLCTPQYWRLDSTYRRPPSYLPYQYWLRHEITSLDGQYLLWDHGQLVDSIPIAGSTNGQPYHIHRIQYVSPDTLVFVAGDSSYHRSTKLMAGYIHEGSVVITAQIADRPIYSILRSVPDKTMYVEYSQGKGLINYSADRGESWVTANVPMPDSLASEQSSHRLLFQKNDHLVVSSTYWEWLDPTDNLLRTISESTDAGLTWTQRALQTQASYYYDSYHQIWRIDQNELSVSIDDQITWHRRGSEIEVSSIKMFGEDKGFCQDRYGSIFYTEDGFRTPAIPIGNRYGRLRDITIGSDGRPYLLQNEYPRPRRVFTFDIQAEANCQSDNDGDGLRSDIDCDDSDADIYQGNVETPYDGKDNDCDTSTPDDDLDNDGYGIAEDCDDTNPSIYPGAEEISDNQQDDNCNGLIDEVNTKTSDKIKSQVNVYPNPSSDLLHVHCRAVIKELVLVSQNGKVVRRSSNQNMLDVKGLVSELYFLQVITDHTVYVEKVIVL